MHDLILYICVYGDMAWMKNDGSNECFDRRRRYLQTVAREKKEKRK
jgi:hypothetical protein